MCDQKIITQVNVQQLSYDKYTWRTCWSSVPTNIESAEFNRFLSPISMFSSSLASITGNCTLHVHCPPIGNWTQAWLAAGATRQAIVKTAHASRKGNHVRAASRNDWGTVLMPFRLSCHPHLRLTCPHSPLFRRRTGCQKHHQLIAQSCRLQPHDATRVLAPWIIKPFPHG